MHRSVLLAALVAGLPILAACGTPQTLSARCNGTAAALAPGPECQSAVRPLNRMGERQQRNVGVDHSLSQGG